MKNESIVRWSQRPPAQVCESSVAWDPRIGESLLTEKWRLAALTIETTSNSTLALNTKRAHSFWIYFAVSIIIRAKVLTRVVFIRDKYSGGTWIKSVSRGSRFFFFFGTHSKPKYTNSKLPCPLYLPDRALPCVYRFRHWNFHMSKFIRKCFCVSVTRSLM